MKIDDELKTINSKLDGLLTKIIKIETILLGKGSKGHEQRITDLEKFHKTTKNDKIKRRMLEVSIMGLIVGGLEFLISLTIKGLKY